MNNQKMFPRKPRNRTYTLLANPDVHSILTVLIDSERVRAKNLIRHSGLLEQESTFNYLIRELTDYDFIDREQDGHDVYYMITPFGKEILELDGELRELLHKHRYKKLKRK